MPNRGGSSWKRLSGVSAAKSRISRRTGVPFTKSGRQRKVGRMATGGGCALTIAMLALMLAAIACGSTGVITPTAAPHATSTLVKSQSVATTVPTQSSGPHAKNGANLRAGPGTNYAKIGSAAVGQALDIVGRNPAGDWYQLADGSWIAGFLVTNAPASVPVAAEIPTPAAGAPAPVRAIAVPTARGLPSAAASTCDCDHGNTLNCDDFTDWDAQACYLRCMELKHDDVHGLDRDSDGNACEWNY